MRRGIIFSFLAVLFAAGSGLAGCRRAELSGPPDLRVGRDQCAECGMIISEERFSSAMLIERGGMREHLLFDDIGCMLDYERWNLDDARAVDRFVHDHGSKSWRSATGASFLFADSDALPTPMGSGIAAFAEPAGAESARERFGGEVLDYTALASAREKWMRDRYGERRGGP